jgi:acyl carrier protein
MRISKMQQEVLKIINEILKKQNKEEISELVPTMSFRDDFGFDSLMLAEFTVKIEDVYDVDIFEDGLVDGIQEILEKLA